MSTISDLSVFGNYSQNENRVTAALLHIFKLGGTEFIGNVISELDEIDFPSSEIQITTQTKENSNIYDGLLECNFSFRILIESKITHEAINPKQLEGLIKNSVNPSDYILYITTDYKKPKLLEGIEKVYWTNWKEILAILIRVAPEKETLNFLIGEFEKFLDALNLLDVVTDEDRVQIAAGSLGEPIALEYNFYACQNNRNTRKSKYLAFYNKGGIHTLFEIIGEPINDYNLLKNAEISGYIEKYEPNYTESNYRQFYKLKLLKDNLNIENDQINKNGKSTPFTMGSFRYTTIQKLLNAKTTGDLI